jgi:hypothetical protein
LVAVLQHRPPNQQRDDRGDPVRVVVRMRRHHAQRSAYRGTLASAARFGYRSSRQPTDQRSRAVVFTLSMARTLDSSIDPDNEWRLPGCPPDSGYCLCSAGTAMVPVREPTVVGAPTPVEDEALKRRTCTPLLSHPDVAGGCKACPLLRCNDEPQGKAHLPRQTPPMAQRLGRLPTSNPLDVHALRQDEVPRHPGRRALRGS